MSNRIIHFEMNVKNPEKAIKFYQNTFGWKIEKWECPVEYWLIMTGDEKELGIDGGLGREEEGFPNVVNTIGINNIDAVIKKVKANGGKIVRDKHAVPGVGWLAYIKDPEGILSGIMEEDPEAR